MGSYQEPGASTDPARRLAEEDNVRLFLLVEGTNDIQFLRRISATLSQHDADVEPLESLERSSQLLILPFGGGDIRLWSHRLAPLARREFHLIDAEGSPETEVRRRVVSEINQRPGCEAVLTNKRSLENYLHGDAIFEASQLRVVVDDRVDVADRTAQLGYERGDHDVAWLDLSARARKRFRDRAKRWLNTRAVDRMTPRRLSARDLADELASWLRKITSLATSEPGPM